jgi:predicted RNA polymerase sigma factor
MAGGTHVFDMIKRLKENENLKKNNYFKTRGAYTRISKSINVDYRQATDLERDEIRRRLIEERRNETRKFILTLALSTVFTGILIILFLKYVRP